jgi:hypothetical protein
MADAPDKQELLKGAAQSAIAKQPDEIHLIPAPQHAWSNAAAVEAYASALQKLGFTEAGKYTIDMLPMTLQFFLKSAERMYSVTGGSP